MTDFVAINRWHRYLGFVASVFLLSLAITGVLLNHASPLQLSHKPLPAWAASVFYGVSAEPLPVAVIAAGDLYMLEGDALQLGGNYLGHCGGGLIGIAEGSIKGIALGNGDAGDTRNRQRVTGIACAEDLLLVTNSGEVLDHYSVSTGLPQPLRRIGFVGSQLVVNGGTGDVQSWTLDPLVGQFSPFSEMDNSALSSMPLPVREAAVEELTYQRLLLDLHAGRVLGGSGVWLMDAAAIALIVLVVSGYWSWYEKRKIFGG